MFSTNRVAILLGKPSSYSSISNFSRFIVCQLLTRMSGCVVVNATATARTNVAGSKGSRVCQSSSFEKVLESPFSMKGIYGSSSSPHTKKKIKKSKHKSRSSSSTRGEIKHHKKIKKKRHPKVSTGSSSSNSSQKSSALSASRTSFAPATPPRIRRDSAYKNVVTTTSGGTTASLARIDSPDLRISPTVGISKSFRKTNSRLMKSPLLNGSLTATMAGGLKQSKKLISCNPSSSLASSISFKSHHPHHGSASTNITTAPSMKFSRNVSSSSTLSPTGSKSITASSSRQGNSIGCSNGIVANGQDTIVVSTQGNNSDGGSYGAVSKSRSGIGSSVSTSRNPFRSSQQYRRVSSNGQLAQRRNSTATVAPASGFSMLELARGLKTSRFKKIVIMSGAGISTASGIPDFRTPGTGLYDNLQQYQIPEPSAIFDITYFVHNPRPFFTLARELYPGKFPPNIAHHFIKLLQDKDLLLRHYTQNIDGLERLAGIKPGKLVESHGSFATASCTVCQSKHDPIQTKELIFKDKMPHCKHKFCKGIVKPDIVFFGEDLPHRFHSLRYTDLAECDLLLVMGTSLEVEPFAGLVTGSKYEVPRVLINREAVGPFRHQRKRPKDLCLMGDIGDQVTELARLAGWTDELKRLEANYKEAKNEETTFYHTTTTTSSSSERWNVPVPDKLTHYTHGRVVLSRRGPALNDERCTVMSIEETSSHSSSSVTDTAISSSTDDEDEDDSSSEEITNDISKLTLDRER